VIVYLARRADPRRAFFCPGRGAGGVAGKETVQKAVPNLAGWDAFEPRPLLTFSAEAFLKITRPGWSNPAGLFFLRLAE
jgi:hypothetical protein